MHHVGNSRVAFALCPAIWRPPSQRSILSHCEHKIHNAIVTRPSALLNNFEALVIGHWEEFEASLYSVCATPTNDACNRECLNLDTVPLV